MDREATAKDRAAFQEGTMEVTETAEKPVVSKTARVVEEVVVGKDVKERTETVHDTVKRSDVKVEGAQTQGMKAFETYNTDFRNDYQSKYASKGRKYEEYEPAYRYGYTLANDQRYRGQDWSAIEQSASGDWSKHGKGPWQEFKDAVRYAWDKARGASRRAA